MPCEAFKWFPKDVPHHTTATSVQTVRLHTLSKWQIDYRTANSSLCHRRGCCRTRAGTVVVGCSWTTQVLHIFRCTGASYVSPLANRIHVRRWHKLKTTKTLALVATANYICFERSEDIWQFLHRWLNWSIINVGLCGDRPCWRDIPCAVYLKHRHRYGTD